MFMTTSARKRGKKVKYCVIICVLGIGWWRWSAQEEVAHCGRLILRRERNRWNQEDGGDKLINAHVYCKQFITNSLTPNNTWRLVYIHCFYFWFGRCVGEERARLRRGQNWRSRRTLWWKCLSKSTNPSSLNLRSPPTRSLLRAGSGTRPSG